MTIKINSSTDSQSAVGVYAMEGGTVAGSSTSVPGTGRYALTGSISTDPVALQFYKSVCVQCTVTGSGGVPPYVQFAISGSVDGQNFWGIASQTLSGSNGVMALNASGIAMTHIKANVNRITGSVTTTAELLLCVI